jgi:ABC-2 type transport system ATP-binding protein
MVEVHRLAKRFGTVEALRGVCFKTRKGTITAMLGENGAGKTTTLKILLGFLRPDSGTVIIAPGRVGYVPDRPAYFTWLDGRTILGLSDGQANGKDSGARILAVARDLLFDPALLRRRPGSYSAGNAKKFAYLQNLAFKPDLLVVDEPFAALDPPSIKCVRDLFLELRDTGTTLLLSSHMLAEMERIADGFIVLRRGTAIAHAALREWRLMRAARTAPDLESVFLHLTGS